jgi:galactokinase
VSHELRSRVLEEFRSAYGEPAPLLVRAPGRVNLIGEHTDYNDGFVLPMAIERAVWIALQPLDDARVRLRSLDFGDTREFALEGLLDLARRVEEMSWIEYVRGSMWTLGRSGGRLQGWEGVVAGDVPVGAGLSSSAALEIATLRAATALTGEPWRADRMARLGQEAENRWVGMNCGIMDQMISAGGRAGHALLIDCRSLETEPVTLPAGTVAVVMDTATRRGLVDSEYNDRRASCEEAARQLGVRALRDVSVRDFLAREGGLGETIRRRARHVVTENERTLEAASSTDPERLGELMDESHESLRDDFEVSTSRLDLMAELARETDGCFGARMTGAGFGGCAVALVAEEAAEAFTSSVARRYATRSGLEPVLFATAAADGATIEASSSPS